MKRETRIVLLILATWFCVALAVGFSGRFESVSAPIVAGTVWALTALALLACWIIGPINRWIKNVDLRCLIALHLARFVGIYFLILCQRGELSCTFARPAGIGDIVVAAAGAVVLVAAGRDGALRRPNSSAWNAYRWLLLWNGFGLLDIVFVAFSALRVGLSDPPSMAPIRALPLSLLPTFFVPLIIASHIVIFARVSSRRGVSPRS